MWNGLREKIFDLNLPFGKVRIYQDGLPVCDKELDIVREVAKKGSRNHEIVLDLVGKGAKLEGTEDIDLLLEEYKNLREHYPGGDTEENKSVVRKYRRIAGDLLVKRDKFIARRIENTLADGEIGILFIGLQHAVDKYLRGIKISYLIHRLPFRESYEVRTAG